MNPLEKKLYRELSKHILSIYMDPSKIVEPIQLVDDCVLRLVRYDELGDKENESRDFPQYADDFSVNSDIEEKEEHSQSDDITPPVTGAEENMLADEDEGDDGYTYDISDVDRIVIGTRDDELESGSHDDEFDSEEEDEEEKLEEVQAHRLREVGETERRQLQKDGVTKPINESSPKDDEELKDARENPGLFRQLPPEEKRSQRKRQHDLYQHLGQRVSVYFKLPTGLSRNGWSMWGPRMPGMSEQRPAGLSRVYLQPSSRSTDRCGTGYGRMALQQRSRR